MKVRIAVTPPPCALKPHAFAAYLEACERHGFDTLWLSDIPLGPSPDPLVSLAFAAAATQRLRLGANIVPLGRNPLLLAKQLAHLDQLSGGRLLLSFVPGLGEARERAALGFASGHRGKAVDQMIALLRRWWAGETITASAFGFEFESVALGIRPAQRPLEVWLGGKEPAALSRVARLADGWLTSALTPREAGQARAAIQREAEQLGRTIDAEHFGISMPVARRAPPEAALASLRARREDRDLSGVVAVGATAVADLIRAHVDVGLSKFVLRSVDSADWRDELAWLADIALPLQT